MSKEAEMGSYAVIEVNPYHVVILLLLALTITSTSNDCRNQRIIVYFFLILMSYHCLRYMIKVAL